LEATDGVLNKQYLLRLSSQKKKATPRQSGGLNAAGHVSKVDAVLSLSLASDEVVKTGEPGLRRTSSRLTSKETRSSFYSRPSNLLSALVKVTPHAF
jgi:hypothetical protein